VNYLEQLLGDEWKLYPAGGSSGEAFLAVNHTQKLFVKRNSSPFLAVLSAEGIVPKLLWTKRLTNGDVLTAQQWIEGRRLRPDEMQCRNVAMLLKKIHASAPLLALLKRTDGNCFSYFNCEIELELVKSGLEYVYESFEQYILFLEEGLEKVKSAHQVVCHCDLSHHNFLLDEYDELYLVDWDQTKIADPAYDIAFILLTYVPSDIWNEWLEVYNNSYDRELIQRVKWYVILIDLIAISNKNKQGTNQLDLAYELTKINKIFISI
jgi:thiamine kinase-like enzyme